MSAPWIFSWVQELLRFLAPLLGGVLIPLGVFLVLGALPFVQPQDFGEGTGTLGKRLIPLVVLVLALVGIAFLSAMHFLR